MAASAADRRIGTLDFRGRLCYLFAGIAGCFLDFGVRPPEAEEMCPLHKPGMAPDERAIRVGIDMLVATGLRFLKKG